MRPRLADLSACFEGVIPSIIATAAADGMPNVSYLSHVIRIGDEHVALSNQFFAKTAANVRANPKVTLILVDGLTGDQYLLDVSFVRSVDAGYVFEKIARQLKATSAQLGMADVMRLKSADIFRVAAIEKVPAPINDPASSPDRQAVDLVVLSDTVSAIDRQVDPGGIIDSLLEGVRRIFGYEHALVLIREDVSGTLTTMGSIGYARSGLGSEISDSEGLIGTAARSGEAIKVNDMSRLRRFGEAIALNSDAAENSTRAIAFPDLPTANSQIAVPMVFRGAVLGVLFVESEARLAFREEDEAALLILATQAASALRASEREAAQTVPVPVPPLPATIAGRGVHVIHHRYDDSIFIDGTYIVKGIAGALLRLILEWHLNEGRNVFTNREMRLAAGPRLPEIKDNLETRLLLLRRRLEEKGAALRIVRVERGRLRLEAEGPITLKVAGE
ncbi:GAF domain-containing protein [Fuscibacter oryzae]|uniref:GAF domain-containing protein n=1 Tax=Fuscibacter oryzae TaxID=2803939 RepID=A0A8J7MS57_9RHOB|nr:GAF domain-containing protein [Fuscibacter oryzae]MBL4928511.1 GAF domain-containing protein [Fuscibacter oryzae]